MRPRLLTRSPVSLVAAPEDRSRSGATRSAGVYPGEGVGMPPATIDKP
jgi:hypothetical protein